eukprot:scaffold2208_cov170-Ochromonas_danica.AAC.3
MEEEDLLELLWEVDSSLDDLDFLLSNDEKSPEDSLTTPSLQSDITTRTRKRRRRKRANKQHQEEQLSTTKHLQQPQHIKHFRSSFTRMVKDDLRRVFSAMFCNVINQNNYTHMQTFFNRYLSSNCDVISYGCPVINVSLTYMKGPNEFANFMDAVSSPYPDFSLLLVGSQILRLYHEDMYVVEMFASMKATRLIYPYASSSSVGGTVYHGPRPLQVVNAEAKIKMSFFMNSEGAIVKIGGWTMTSFPAFLTTTTTTST